MITTKMFDDAAYNLLGDDYQKLVSSGSNRVDLCREIAQRAFILDFQPTDKGRAPHDLHIVQTVAYNIRKNGTLGLDTVDETQDPSKVVTPGMQFVERNTTMEVVEPNPKIPGDWWCKGLSADTGLWSFSSTTILNGHGLLIWD